MIEINKIHQGDCLELMKQIEDNSLDMIFVDPPYNISKENDNRDRSNNSPENLQTLCLRCHNEKDSKNGRIKKGEIRNLKRLKK